MVLVFHMFYRLQEVGEEAWIMCLVHGCFYLKGWVFIKRYARDRVDKTLRRKDPLPA